MLKTDLAGLACRVWTTTMRLCPTCASSYPGGDFCPNDGSPLQAAPTAPAAGAPASTGVTDRGSRTGSAVVDPLVGRVIAGRYVLQAFLGGGTMGVVYRAGHNVLERDFAVKLLRKEFCDDEKTLRRFLREAKVASLVDHDHIVRIHDFGQTEEHEPYLVMEHVTGVTLFKVITEHPGGHLPMSRALSIMQQVARALAHAHARGVIHRDIKPENIVLTDGAGQGLSAGVQDGDFVKILDFGVAKILGQQAISAAGEVLGTPEFLAPEGLLGTDVGAPADLYALGAMLHDAIIGSPPFSGSLRDILHQHLSVTPKLLSERRPELRVPPALDLLTQRLLAKEPKERPTAEEAAAQLQQVRATLNERPDRIDPTKTMVLPRGAKGDVSLQLPARLLALAAAEAGERGPIGEPLPGGRGEPSLPSVIVSQGLQLQGLAALLPPGHALPPTPAVAAPLAPAPPLVPPPPAPSYSSEQRARAVMPTVFSSAVLQDEAGRAAALERLGQQIHEVAEALARRMYNPAATPNAMPERLVRLRGEIAAHEELEVSLGTQLALLDERLRQGAGDVSAREGQQALRHKLSEAQERALALRRELGQLLIGQPDARGHDAERQPLELLLAQLEILLKK